MSDTAIPWSRGISLALHGEEALLARLREVRQQPGLIRHSLLVAVIAAAVFGVALGSYGMSAAQVAAAAVKVPLLLIGTSVLCFPAFHVLQNVKASRPLVPPLPAVRIRPERLERVLFGLLENALKFSPQGGRITVRAGSRDGDLLLEVEDQGPGVPPELRREIFDWHFSGGRGSTGSTGIGLAIIHSLVTQAGGRVWVEESPRGGARFCCALPTA